MTTGQALSKQLLVPKGIRFDCSGCGNCCLRWPVPLTRGDVEQLSALPGGQGESHRFKMLPPEPGASFAFMLDKREDGRCEFLTETDRCRLHELHGARSKPSMCRLFPYSFNVMPHGVAAYVSFASTAVLFNQGSLLSGQSESLSAHLELFAALFPDATAERWTAAQIRDGVPLGTDELREISSRMLAIAHSGEEPESEHAPRELAQKLFAIHRLVSELGADAACNRPPVLEARPKIVDQLLLKYMDALYFPADVFSEGNFDLDCRGMMQEIVSAPDMVTLSGTRFRDLVRAKRQEDEFTEICDRFLYCRLFSGLYFGPGFHHLSLIAGTTHLILLCVLLELKCRQLKLRGVEDLAAVAELVRTLERRLTQLRLSAQSQAVLEVLFSEPERASRLLSLIA